MAIKILSIWFTALLLLITTKSFAVVDDNGNRNWSLLNTTDSVSAYQLGTWNLTNITGTITLPTGAATSANQSTEIGSLSSIATNTANTVSALNGLSIVSTSALQTSEISQLTQIATNTASALNDTTQSGSITTGCATESGCASTSYVMVNSQGAYTISASITGTFVGTYVVDNQLEDGTWVPAPFYIVTSTLPYAAAFTGTTVQQFYITGGGVLATRVRCSAYTSGTINVGLDASLAQQTTFSAQLGNWTIQPLTNSSIVKAQLQDNSGTAITLGQKTMAASVPVAIASDQTNIPVKQTDTMTSGTLTALNSTLTVSALATNTVTIQVLGTYVGTVQFFYSMDNGATYNSLYGTFLNGNFQQTNQTVNGTGQFSFQSASFTNVQAKMTSYTSGTANIVVTTSFGSQGGNQRIQDSNGNNLLSDLSNRLQVLSTPVDGAKTTYSAAASAIAVPAAATDIFCINGSATKTIRVLKFRLTETETTSSTMNILLLKRSTADTGGTSTTMTNVSHDSTNSAATAVVKAYTANPTVGTLVGNLRASKFFGPASGTNGQELIWQFADLPAQGLVIRGTAEGACVNQGGAAQSGESLTVDVEWTEE